MFLRKLTVLLVPLAMLMVLCLLAPLFYAMSPYSGATRLREPFAWLLWVPAAVILLILLYQFLASQGTGRDLPVLRLLATTDSRIIILEASFAAYMLTFSVRTGKGI